MRSTVRRVTDKGEATMEDEIRIGVTVTGVTVTVGHGDSALNRSPWGGNRDVALRPRHAPSPRPRQSLSELPKSR
jgi:hypothetical protein